MGLARHKNMKERDAAFAGKGKQQWGLHVAKGVCSLRLGAQILLCAVHLRAAPALSLQALQGLGFVFSTQLVPWGAVCTQQLLTAR